MVRRTTGLNSSASAVGAGDRPTSCTTKPSVASARPTGPPDADVPDQGGGPPRHRGRRRRRGLQRCPPLPDLVARYEAAGGKLLACPICFDSRKLDKDHAREERANSAEPSRCGSGSATTAPPRSATDPQSTEDNLDGSAADVVGGANCTARDVPASSVMMSAGPTSARIRPALLGPRQQPVQRRDRARAAGHWRGRRRRPRPARRPPRACSPTGHDRTEEVLERRARIVGGGQRYAPRRRARRGAPRRRRAAAPPSSESAGTPSRRRRPPRGPPPRWTRRRPGRRRRRRPPTATRVTVAACVGPVPSRC